MYKDRMIKFDPEADKVNRVVENDFTKPDSVEPSDDKRAVSKDPDRPKIGLKEIREKYGI
jgi:hypothetical protein